MNIGKLRGKMAEKRLSIAALAAQIGIDRATFYRKMRNETFTVREAVAISKALELNSEDIMIIFFNHGVA